MALKMNSYKSGLTYINMPLYFVNIKKFNTPSKKGEYDE